MRRTETKIERGVEKLHKERKTEGQRKMEALRKEDNDIKTENGV